MFDLHTKLTQMMISVFIFQNTNSLLRHFSQTLIRLILYLKNLVYRLAILPQNPSVPIGVVVNHLVNIHFPPLGATVSSYGSYSVNDLVPGALIKN